jgi:hypothetical protein
MSSANSGARPTWHASTVSIPPPPVQRLWGADPRKSRSVGSFSGAKKHRRTINTAPSSGQALLDPGAALSTAASDAAFQAGLGLGVVWRDLCMVGATTSRGRLEGNGVALPRGLANDASLRVSSTKECLTEEPRSCQHQAKQLAKTGVGLIRSISSSAVLTTGVNCRTHAVANVRLGGQDRQGGSIVLYRRSLPARS